MIPNDGVWSKLFKKYFNTLFLDQFVGHAPNGKSQIQFNCPNFNHTPFNKKENYVKK